MTRSSGPVRFFGAIVLACGVGFATLPADDESLRSPAPDREPTAGLAVRDFLAPDGSLDVEALRTSGVDGPIDLGGYRLRMDAGSSQPRALPPLGTSAVELWSDEFGLNGTNDVVNALLVQSQNVIIGGAFTEAGSIFPNRIARWNGLDWSEYGTGIAGTINAVCLLNDTLVVGGTFVLSGGRNRVAMWTGSAWQGMGSGLNNTVRALTVYKGKVCAGGSFTGLVASWSPVTGAWTAIGGGAVGSSVRAMTVFPANAFGDLIVAGGLTMLGPTAVSNIGRWNGATWAGVGAGLDGAVHALAPFGGALYAGGEFLHVGGGGGPALNGVAAWNGTAWQARGSGVSGIVYAIAVYQNEVNIGGSFPTNGAGTVTLSNMARWTGTAWSALLTGTDGTVKALAARGDSLYVGGEFTHVDPDAVDGGREALHLAVWNGNLWTEFEGEGMGGRVMALATYGAKLYAGGQFLYAGGEPAGAIAQWDGEFWTDVGGGMSSGQTPYVAAFALIDGKLAAGGSFSSAGGVASSNVALWNGGTWESAGDGLVGGDVRCLIPVAAGGDSVLIAGGGFQFDAFAHDRRFVAAYTPLTDTWQAMGPGLNDTVSAFAVFGGQLVAGGRFTSNFDGSAGPLTRLARWNGSSWTSLDNSLNGIVRALATMNGQLIVGGEFTTPAPYLLAWNSPGWTSPGVPDGPVHALAVLSDSLVIGGYFTHVNGVTASRVALYRQGLWVPVDDGLNNGVLALNRMGTSLFAGGVFTTANGTASHFVGERRAFRSTAVPEPDPRPAAPRVNWSLAPNPFRNATRVRFEVPHTGRVRLAVFDAAGRRVRQLFDGIREAAVAEVTWDGLDDAGRPVVGGMYWITLEFDQARTSRKILRLP